MSEFLLHYRIKPIRAIARLLRGSSTISEEKLWRAIRNRQLGGLKFRRQHPVGPSVVDFYCHEKHLAVEIDGPDHNWEEVSKRDQARQELIEAYGIRFLRCTNEDVEMNLPEVLKKILEAAKD